MKIKVAWMVAPLLLAPLAEAQEISRLEIAKDPNGAEPRTSIDLYMPVDISNLDVNNPIDAERTRLLVAKDDAGGDLLAAHDAANAEWAAQGYETQGPIGFSGIGDYANNKDVNIGIVLKTVPSPGAKSITIEGTVALNFIDPSSATEASVKAIPIEMAWDNPGVTTPIGLLKIEPASSMVMDDVLYQGYQVLSPTAPVIAVKVRGGDASEEANSLGMGLEPGMFVIKGDPPQTVDLEITYAGSETREFPFKLSFSIGL